LKGEGDWFYKRGFASLQLSFNGEEKYRFLKGLCPFKLS